MKTQIAITIETRSNQTGCSRNCPYLTIQVGNPHSYECHLFGLLDRPAGWRCIRRHPKCIEAEAAAQPPAPEAPRATAWDRLNEDDEP